MADPEPAERIHISVVVRCFNEEACVEELTGELIGVLDGLRRPAACARRGLDGRARGHCVVVDPAGVAAAAVN